MHVEYRHHEHLGHIGGIAGRAGVFGKCGVADLVVDHHVDGAPGGVAGQLAHVQGFSHHALPGKCRIPMQQQGDHLAARVIAADLLARPDNALHHRVHCLKMTRVADQIGIDARPPGQLDMGQVAVVVFDIPVAGELVRVVAGFKLGKKIFKGLVQDVGLHVKPAAVGHAQNQFFGAQPGQMLQQGVQHGNQGISAFQGKPRHGLVFFVQETLQHGGSHQHLQNALPDIRIQICPVAHRLHAILQPAALSGVLQVHILHTHRAAVGLFQGADDLLQWRLFHERKLGRGKNRLEIIGAQPEFRELQQGMGSRTGAQRIHARQQVPQVPIAVDQGRHLGRRHALGSLRCRVAALQANIKALEKNLPFAADRIRVVEILLILRIQKCEVQSFGNLHGLPLRRTRPGDRRRGCNPDSGAPSRTD